MVDWRFAEAMVSPGHLAAAHCRGLRVRKGVYYCGNVGTQRPGALPASSSVGHDSSTRIAGIHFGSLGRRLRDLEGAYEFKHGPALHEIYDGGSGSFQHDKSTNQVRCSYISSSHTIANS